MTERDTPKRSLASVFSSEGYNHILLNILSFAPPRDVLNVAWSCKTACRNVSLSVELQFRLQIWARHLPDERLRGSPLKDLERVFRWQKHLSRLTPQRVESIELPPAHATTRLKAGHALTPMRHDDRPGLPTSVQVIPLPRSGDSLLAEQAIMEEWERAREANKEEAPPRPRLQPVWTIDLPAEAVAVDCDPRQDLLVWGESIAISTAATIVIRFHFDAFRPPANGRHSHLSAAFPHLDLGFSTSDNTHPLNLAISIGPNGLVAICANAFLMQRVAVIDWKSGVTRGLDVHLGHSSCAWLDEESILFASITTQDATPDSQSDEEIFYDARQDTASEQGNLALTLQVKRMGPKRRPGPFDSDNLWGWLLDDIAPLQEIAMFQLPALRYDYRPAGLRVSIHTDESGSTVMIRLGHTRHGDERHRHLDLGIIVPTEHLRRLAPKSCLDWPDWASAVTFLPLSGFHSSIASNKILQLEANESRTGTDRKIRITLLDLSSLAVARQGRVVSRSLGALGKIDPEELDLDIASVTLHDGLEFGSGCESHCTSRAPDTGPCPAPSAPTIHRDSLRCGVARREQLLEECCSPFHLPVRYGRSVSVRSIAYEVKGGHDIVGISFDGERLLLHWGCRFEILTF